MMLEEEVTLTKVEANNFVPQVFIVLFLFFIFVYLLN
jgi:hypothetical protein